MKKLKKKTLILIIVAALVVIATCLCLFNKTINTSIKNKIEDVSISIDKKLYGYSKKEIENIINGTELIYDSYDLYEVSDKLTLNPDDSFNDSIFDNVEEFTYFGSVTYRVDDNTVQSVTIDDTSFTINIVLNSPIADINVDENQINYLDSDLGLLSIRDLHLNESQTEQVIKYGEDKLLEKLNSEENISLAKQAEEKLYTHIYSEILQDVEGISMLRIDVTIEG